MSIKNNPFPHLLPPDVPVWKRFLAKFGSMFYRIDYDVRVGDGRPVSPTEPKNIKKMAIMLSQMRIDAVGFSSAGVAIIEITRHAGLKAIGQLETYPILYQKKYRPRARIYPILVCESINSDILPILKQKQIDYVLLPEE